MRQLWWRLRCRAGYHPKEWNTAFDFGKEVTVAVTSYHCANRQCTESPFWTVADVEYFPKETTPQTGGFVEFPWDRW